MLVGVLVSCGEKNKIDKLPKEIDNPSSEYVIECLKKIPLITKIEAVTERNDPNGNLNKQGGYTAQVFFSYALVDQSEFDEETVVDKGTDCGGSVEVYRTEKDAKKRDKYLSTFDGGPVASGSHTVVGTVIVRTSCKLTASQQRSLEYDIIAALKGEDDKINKTNPYEDEFNFVMASSSHGVITPRAVREYYEEKQYSSVEINYIIDYCGVDWKIEARRRIEGLAEYNDGVTKNVMYEQLIYEEFSEEEYEYGISKCNVDWVKEAEEYLKKEYSDYTKEEVVEWYYNDLCYELIGEGYSETEAERAMEAVYG